MNEDFSKFIVLKRKNYQLEISTCSLLNEKLGFFQFYGPVWIVLYLLLGISYHLNKSLFNEKLGSPSFMLLEKATEKAKTSLFFDN